MKQPLRRTVLVLAALALAGVMCSVTSPVRNPPTPDAIGKQATLAAMQGTLDVVSAHARQTANAWMTLVAPGTAEPGRQTSPTALPTGTIKGRLSFPAGKAIALRVVAFNLDGTYATIEVKDKEDYTLAQIPEGEYYVVAYPMTGDGQQAGGYSAAVTCGLLESCEDHTLIIVKVKADEVTAGIDPTDWSAPPGTFPPQP